MLPRGIVTISSAWDKIKSIFYFYTGQEYESSYMLENIWLIPGSIHIIPEIDFDKIVKISGMNISIVTSAKTDNEGRALLTKFGMPFRK